MDELAALRLATDEFARRLAQVPPDGWGAPTPCPDWSVRDLCDHLVGGNRFTVLVLGGAEWRTAVREVRDGDFTGDPAALVTASETLVEFIRAKAAKV